MSEAAKKRIPQILGAFIAGLVIAFGGGVIYWNLQQNIRSAQAAKPLPERSARPAATPIQTAPAGAEASPTSPTESSGDSAVTRTREPSPRVKRPQPVDVPAAADAYAVVRQSGPGPKIPPVQTPIAAALPDSNRVSAISPSAEQVLTAPPDTLITVRLADSLSSESNRAGESFQAALVAPLVVNGIVIARAGSTALGRITQVRKTHMIGSRSELVLTLTDLTAADGRLIGIATNDVEQKGSHIGLAGTAKAATGAAIGAVMGAVNGAAEGAGFRSGIKDMNKSNEFAGKRATVFAAGAQLSFVLASPVVVSLKSDRQEQLPQLKH